MARVTKLLTGFIALVSLVAVAAFVAEVTLRKYVPTKFADHAREYLQLSSDHEVDVQLNGVMLLQIAAGEFNGVRLEIPDAPLKDGMRATLIAEAGKMPLNPQKRELVDATVSARFTSEQLGEVIRALSRGVGQEVQIEAGELTVSNSVSIFGQKIPIKLSFTPEAKNGALHITPKELNASGFVSLSIDQLANIPQLSKFTDGFDICIADKLPKGVTLKDVNLSTAQTMTVTVSLNERIGVDKSLQEFGTCD